MQFQKVRALLRFGIALAVLCLPLAAQGATQVYYVVNAADLVNQGSYCGTTPPSYYNGCNPSPTGVQWTDTLAAGSTVSAVSIDFNVGVDCAGTVTYTTALNGTAGGNFTGTSYCNCSPRAQVYTLTPPVSAYKVGMLNQFLVTNPTTCLGNCGNAAIGTGGATPFARITVTYTAGGPPPAGDPWPTQLPGAYSAGSAGRIVGTNLDTPVSTRATQASLDALRGFVTTNLNVQVSTRATQTSVDALSTKLDAMSAGLLRMEIEAALANGCPGNSGHDYRISTYYLPEAYGGHLALVRTIVVETITREEAAGLPVYNATLYLAEGDEAAAAGNYRYAWDQYRLAYGDATR